MAAPATGAPTTTTTSAHPELAPLLDLGGRRHDLTHRALVMGILNRTPDSFYDKGATYELDKLYGRAEQLVAEGADILDVGGVKAGPGPEVTEAEELDRVVPVVAGLVARFDTPVSVDTWRASVARASYAAGRGDGQRHQRPGRSRRTRPPPPSTRPPSSSRTSVSPRGWPIPTPTTTTS